MKDYSDEINAVSACWSSLPYEMAIQNIADGTVEPILGQLYTEHVQLCPQHPDHISEELIERLMEKFTQIQFRLHSDVRLVNKRGITIDLIDFNSDTQWYFETLAQYSKQMNAPLYSLHAGTRRDYSIEDLFIKLKNFKKFLNVLLLLKVTILLVITNILLIHGLNMRLFTVLV